MKRFLMAGSAMLAVAGSLALASAPAQAAAPPETIICLGQADGAGSFTTLDVAGTATCVDVSVNRLVETVKNAVGALAGLRPPSTVPTAADLQNAINVLTQADLSSPFGALGAAFSLCSALHADLTCGPLVSGALIVVATAGGTSGTVNMTGNGEPCSSGTQTAAGGYGTSDAYSAAWTAKYNSLGVGTLSGTATSVFTNQTYKLNGIIGPGCGPGLKLLVMNVG